MINLILIISGRLISFVSRFLNLGNGSTWPGEVALSINPNFIKQAAKKNNFKIILIAGTNGKTTTTKLIRTILEDNNKKVFQNESGANLLNGIASSIIENSSIFGEIKKDFAIFEIDENTLPLILKQVNPDYLILLNLFRDQLDRYGEVNTIAKKWQFSILNLPIATTLVLNSDDPLIANLSKGFRGKSVFFGLSDSKASQETQHSKDSFYCPNCNSKLTYSEYYFSHIGIWVCKSCGIKRPIPDVDFVKYYPLSGIYNRYNVHAAYLTTKIIGIPEKLIISSLKRFNPVFGRGEIIKKDNKSVQVFLSKNPTSFNESLRTVRNLGANNVIMVLNDRIPDGKDISWIWDIEMENYIGGFTNIIITGDRAYDMGLRVKYSGNKIKMEIIQNLDMALKKGLNLTKENEILYVLPTYSAMLEVRKILTGKKIL